MTYDEFRLARRLLTEERIGHPYREAVRRSEAVEEAAFEASKAELRRQEQAMGR